MVMGKFWTLITHHNNRRTLIDWFHVNLTLFSAKSASKIKDDIFGAIDLSLPLLWTKLSNKLSPWHDVAGTVRKMDQ